MTRPKTHSSRNSERVTCGQGQCITRDWWRYMTSIHNNAISTIPTVGPTITNGLHEEVSTIWMLIISAVSKPTSTAMCRVEWKKTWVRWRKISTIRWQRANIAIGLGLTLSRWQCLYMLNIQSSQVSVSISTMPWTHINGVATPLPAVYSTRRRDSGGETRIMCHLTRKRMARTVIGVVVMVGYMLPL